MAEARQRLASTLAELEQELHELAGLDEQSRSLLQHAAAEIQRKLAADQPAGSPAPGQSTLRAQLEGQIVAFEASHPRLTAILSRTLDALSQLGV